MMTLQIQNHQKNIERDQTYERTEQTAAITKRSTASAKKNNEVGQQSTRSSPPQDSFQMRNASFPYPRVGDASRELMTVPPAPLVDEGRRLIML